jgi:preprotein translocase subunit SecB
MVDPQVPGDGSQGVTFSIDKIYLKDLSLENPGAPQSFMTQEQPQVEVGLRTRGEQIQPDV